MLLGRIHSMVINTVKLTDYWLVLDHPSFSAHIYRSLNPGWGRGRLHIVVCRGAPCQPPASGAGTRAHSPPCVEAGNHDLASCSRDHRCGALRSWPSTWQGTNHEKKCIRTCEDSVAPEKYSCSLIIDLSCPSFCGDIEANWLTNWQCSFQIWDLTVRIYSKTRFSITRHIISFIVISEVEFSPTTY